MTRTTQLVAALALSLVSLAALADIPGPGPRTRPPGPPREPVAAAPQAVQVRVTDAKDNVVRLRIPRAMLGAAGAPNAAAAPAPRSDALPTIVIGTALAAAVTLGGLRLVSRRRPSGPALALVLTAGVAIATASVVWANAPAPRNRVIEPAKPAPVAGAFPVIIELADGGEMELTLTADQLSKITPKK
ncbi:MAG TPA: hypothetical protein VEA69_18105 [Tepidisphaeraceae bacterium]|nr:hypothetical protein [Tepidisphaeraceae bacterium]